MRLSAWQRLGIVLSVIWILGAFAFFVHRESDERHKLVELATGLCTTRSNARMDECLSVYEKTRAEVQQIPFYWPNPLILGFGPLPFFWLGGWVCLVLTRWVARGGSEVGGE
jgi:hypothetical protein